MITITFPDGSKREYEKGVTPKTVAKSIAPGLAKKSVAAKIDGTLTELDRPIEADVELELVVKGSDAAFEVLNHSTAHLMAHAVKRLYPDARFGVGPAIDEGFYYDIKTDAAIRDEDLPRIEEEMRRIVKEDLPIQREVATKEEALSRFSADPYKQELIKEIEDETVTLYSQNGFTDLCRGGHLERTSLIKHFKLLSVAGAYWRGDSDREMLTRIYGTSWFSKEELEEYLALREERRERDHRKLGKELKIFMLSDEAGQGLPIWLSNGFTVRRVLEEYVQRLERRYGYKHLATPVLGTRGLYETSGHFKHYKDDMFPLLEDEDESYVLRPMACPHHAIVYKSELRSYRDLPLRYAEIVTQYRYEKSGALTGLERVRAMTLTDAHIFARKDQIKHEVLSAYGLIQRAINDLGLSIEYVELALRDADKGKFHENDELWDEAEKVMKELLDEEGIEYTEMKGEAAFYGPKIDIQVRTALGHIITMSTVQLDFLLPERFDLTYIGEDGKRHRPVLIHRGLVSTWERLMSILLEQYKGAFPAWLAPIQAVIIPVSVEQHLDHAQKIQGLFLDADYRTEVDDREEKLGRKIRDAQQRKIPFQLVIGDNEVKKNTVTYRRYGEKEQHTVAFDEFMELFAKEIDQKK